MGFVHFPGNSANICSWIALEPSHFIFLVMSVLLYDRILVFMTNDSWHSIAVYSSSVFGRYGWETNVHMLQPLPVHVNHGSSLEKGQQLSQPKYGHNREDWTQTTCELFAVCTWHGWVHFPRYSGGANLEGAVSTDSYSRERSWPAQRGHMRKIGRGNHIDPVKNISLYHCGTSFPLLTMCLVFLLYKTYSQIQA